MTDTHRPPKITFSHNTRAIFIWKKIRFIFIHLMDRINDQIGLNVSWNYYYYKFPMNNQLSLYHLWIMSTISIGDKNRLIVFIIITFISPPQSNTIIIRFSFISNEIFDNHLKVFIIENCCFKVFMIDLLFISWPLQSIVILIDEIIFQNFIPNIRKT